MVRLRTAVQFPLGLSAHEGGHMERARAANGLAAKERHGRGNDMALYLFSQRTRGRSNYPPGSAPRVTLARVRRWCRSPKEHRSGREGEPCTAAGLRGAGRTSAPLHPARVFVVGSASMAGPRGPSSPGPRAGGRCRWLPAPGALRAQRASARGRGPPEATRRPGPAGV